MEDILSGTTRDSANSGDYRACSGYARICTRVRTHTHTRTYVHAHTRYIERLYSTFVVVPQTSAFVADSFMSWHPRLLSLRHVFHVRYKSLSLVLTSIGRPRFSFKIVVMTIWDINVTTRLYAQASQIDPTRVITLCPAEFCNSKTPDRKRKRNRTGDFRIVKRIESGEFQRR